MVCTDLYWAPHKIQQQSQCAIPVKLALLHLCGSHFSWFNFFEAAKLPRLLSFSYLNFTTPFVFAEERFSEGRISRASHALHYLSFVKLRMISMCHALGWNRMLYELLTILVASLLHSVFYLKKYWTVEVALIRSMRMLHICGSSTL